MGERKNSYFRVGLNQKLKVGFKGAQITSDGGLVAIREMDERLGLTKIAGEYLKDNRRGKNIRAIPGLYELCEELKIDYAIRIKENKKLAEKVELYTKRC